MVKILEFLNSSCIQYLENYDLSKKSWIRSGGIIKVLIKPKNNEEVVKTLQFIYMKKKNYYTIGNTSNLLIRDGVISTPFINLSKLNRIKTKESKIGLHLFVQSGVSIPIFSKFVVEKGYSGTEGLFGIPGTIGGGIYMNASSFNCCITDFIRKVKFIDKTNKIFIQNKNKLNFSWRHSNFQRDKGLILGAYFFFPKKKNIKIEELKNRMMIQMQLRKKFQENNHPNLGSIFATRNIYRDIKYNSITMLMLYFLYKIINLIFYKSFFNNHLIFMRNFLNKLYFKSLNIKKDRKFSLSSKTINCLINRGSKKSSEGINLIKELQKKFKKKVKLENIILDDIK